VRTRIVLTGIAVALLSLVGGAATAAAQEEGEEPELTHEAEECIEILEGGGEIDECQEAPSPILPATNELIWGSLSFAVLVFLLYKFAWPGLRQGMAARTERIRSDLEEAERAKADAQGVLDEYQRQLADARNESARIIEEARQSADAMRRDLQSRAETDIAALRERAAADVEAAKQQAMADLKAEVSEIAVGAAEMVVKQNLDRDAQIRLVEDYINQVGARQ
jgi:F-type H+-transporting ATPase subunit b